jgi:hypothetical protein
MLKILIGLAALALVLGLLSYGLNLRGVLRRLRPKKPGWRAHWGLEGPLPRDYRGRNPWPSFASVADERRMEFMSGGGKKLSYSSLKATYYTFGGGGVFVCLFANYAMVTAGKPTTLEGWMVFVGLWIVPIALFVLGYHYQRKEDQEEYPPRFVFDRERGTVIVPKFAELPGGEFPFEDVEGYFSKSPANQFGLQNHYLQLVIHAPGSETPLMAFILWAGPVLGYEQALAHWSRLCQYMNRSEPLPNIPQLWETLVHRMVKQHGWRGRAGREAALDEVSHAFAKAMRAQEVKEGLGVEPHVDPASPEYEGPRSYDHYRRLYPTEA